MSFLSHYVIISFFNFNQPALFLQVFYLGTLEAVLTICDSTQANVFTPTNVVILASTSI